jgi:hypothetical protein
MLSKKTVHLQQFDKIDLSNADLTYIRNPKRNKILFMLFHLLKTYIMNPSLFFIFFTLSPTGKHRWQPRSARAYIRAGRWVLPSWFVKLLEGKFSYFVKIRWMPSWLISHQPTVLFSQNKPATSNQPEPASSTLLSEQTSTSHQPPANRTGRWFVKLLELL